MLGGPVLPTISELHRHADPVPTPHFRPLYSGSHGPSPPPRHAQSTDHSPPSTLKRQASQTALPDESPAKKQSKWTSEEDNLTIQLRGQKMKWDDIATRLPGRTSLSCRLRYQNYLEKQAIWDEEKKNKLASLYFRLKEEMWDKVAIQMGIPWRSAEWMHWQLGEQEMSTRACAPVTQTQPYATGTGMSSPLQVPAIPASAPHGFTPVNTPQSMPSQRHQMPQSMPRHPTHRYDHQRTDSGSSVGERRRRKSSFRLRRADAQSWVNIPLQLGQPLQQIQPQSEEDLIGGARTTAVSGIQSIINREDVVLSYMEDDHQRRREKEAAGLSQSEHDARSQGMRSPDGMSQRSATGSNQSIKREPEETERTFTAPLPI